MTMPAALTFTDKSADLAALGVPPAVLQYISTRSYPASYRSLYIANILAMLVTILGVPFAAGLALFRVSARLVASHASRGYLVVENHGLSAFPLCIGLLVLSVPVTQWWI